MQTGAYICTEDRRKSALKHQEGKEVLFCNRRREIKKGKEIWGCGAKRGEEIAKI